MLPAVHTFVRSTDAIIYGGEGGMTWHGVRVMGWKEAGGVYE
jgi:hypothetical protein